MNTHSPALSVEHKTVSIYDLIPSPDNYNFHPQDQLEKLKASLRHFSQVEDVIVKALPDGKYQITAHEGVTTAALQLLEAGECPHLAQWNITIVPNSWSDMDVKGYMVASNLHAKNSEPDDGVLLRLLQEQQDAGFDLAALGSDEAMLARLIEEAGDAILAGDTPDEIALDTDTPGKRPTLSDRFIVPPFSVLDARQGYWQERKRAWLALGIQSELGRGENLIELSEANDEYRYNKNEYLARIGRGPLAQQNKTAHPETASLKDGLTWPTSIHPYDKTGAKRNGLLGESEQARSHYKGKGLARTNGQDLMRGEHTVGENSRPESGRLTWATGKERTDETSRKILAGGRRAADQHSNLNQAPKKPDWATGTGTENMAAGTSIFDPVLCELAYRWFCPPDGMVLDPFAGGSVRGIVAAKCGRRYTGIDLRAEQIAANEAQAKSILSRHASIIIDASDPTLDHTPELTPVMEHGGYRVKRDDLFQIAGVRGGKVRTVWALAQDAQGLITSGSRHSPHVHRVAAIAKRLGIPCRIHIATGENTPDVQGAEDAGAEIIRHPAGYLNVLNARAREDAQETGWTLIPFGVVCDEAVKQVAGQVANLPRDMTRLVIPVGSGITLSGILQGLQQHNHSVPVLGVCVGKDPVEVIDKYAPKGWRDYVTLVHSPLKFEEHPAVTRLGDIPLDPTYEAKCLPYLQEGDVLWSVGVRASVASREQTVIAPAPMPTWIVGDSRTLAMLCPDMQSDLVFTCPPYFDLEVYGDNPDDLSTAHTYDEFLLAYRDILQQAIATLKDNRFVCIVVGDIRDKKGFYRNFVSDTISACQDAGARLYNEAILVTSVGSLPIRVGRQFAASRKLGKTHQNCLVFCKGDPTQAVQDCGPVMVEVPEDEMERVETGEREETHAL